MNQHRLMDIMGGQDGSAVAATARMGLAAAEPGYRAVVALRNRMFDLGLRRSVRLPAATISVGNLTSGGTGKTPMVIELVRRLIEMGYRPAVLTRGYRGGDEAAELRAVLSDAVPVIANPDRVAGARLAMEQDGGVNVFLLDDGFQHRQIARDLDLVLIDATRPFGFERVLPRGLLREPIRNLRRADAVIITRADQVDAEALEELDDRIIDLTGDPPIAHTAHRWADTAGLAEQTVVGVCGIGNSGAFGAMLERHAAGVLRCEAFKDHHAYTGDELCDLLRRAKADGAAAVVTTEKDWGKWKPLLNDAEPALPILRPRLTIHFLDGGDAIHARLRKAANARRFGD